MADVEIDLEITNAQELVSLGIRAHVIGDFSNAAAAFGRATQLMAQEHGDEHDSLGEIYLHYARALLEVSREEAEPLGDAIPHGDSESDSDDEGENGTTSSESKDESPDKTEEPTDADATETKDGATETQDTEDSKDPENKAHVKDTETKEDAERKEKEEVTQNGSTEIEKTDDSGYKDEVQLETISEETAATNGDTETPTQEDGADESLKNEDCSDLQLAWEVLEVAKKIFTNRGVAGKERLSETMILLGEVAMESENFADGMSDMQAGVDIQKSLYEPINRKLAESYYKLGIAHATLSNIDEAIESFVMSMDTLRKRIAMLKSQLQEKKPEDVNKINEEIEEMETLIPEIEEKIADTKSIKEEMTSQLIMGMVSKMPKEIASKEKNVAGASSSKAATDITHLVKRKRKADEEPAEKTEVHPAKKPTP